MVNNRLRIDNPSIQADLRKQREAEFLGTIETEELLESDPDNCSFILELKAPSSFSISPAENETTISDDLSFHEIPWAQCFSDEDVLLMIRRSEKLSSLLKPGKKLAKHQREIECENYFRANF